MLWQKKSEFVNVAVGADEKEDMLTPLSLFPVCVHGIYNHKHQLGILIMCYTVVPFMITGDSSRDTMNYHHTLYRNDVKMYNLCLIS